MEDAPLPAPYETPKEQISESFEIKQNNNNYKLNIKIINTNIILNVLDTKDILKEYEIKLTLDELKQIHKVFLMLNSCQEFLDNIKALIENKKLFIKKTIENKITIELIVEIFNKPNFIKIDLNKKKSNFDLISQDLYKKISVLTDNYKNLELNYHKVIEENNNLKDEINKIKEVNKTIKEENSTINIKIKNLEETINKMACDMNKCIKKEEDIKINTEIMKVDEFDIIRIQIEKTMNKEIKGINKLYQATKDGFDNLNFHKKYKNISNTLIL